MVAGRATSEGDRWVTCRSGHRHWGRYGAAGLLLRDASAGHVLLQHRAAWSHHGGTWALPGGARAAGEQVLAAALREAGEEAGVVEGVARPEWAALEDHGDWSYATVAACLARDFTPVADEESEVLAWVAVDEVAALDLHPSFGAAWPGLRSRLGARCALVVDGANVVGARPDGWWRDRAAAAARLRAGLERLAAAGLPAVVLGAGDGLFPPVITWWPDVVLVLEGTARAAAGPAAAGPAGGATGERVTVVAAPGSGDDAIVSELARLRRDRPDGLLAVATADRGLAQRVAGYGVAVAGPSALRDLLDAVPG